MRLTTLMDISEVDGWIQAQFYLSNYWFDSRLRFRNLKDDISLNSFLPSENTAVWVPELVAH